jgi:lipopolysaccharide transport system permease protein
MTSIEAHTTIIEPGHEKLPQGPLAPLRLSWRYRGLILKLAWREISGRYRGSLLGLSWAVVIPILMLAVYTFVFSVVFGARWQTGDPGSVDSKVDFALVLFAGLIPFNLFAEAILGAPRIILNHPSYVKKVVFPVEVLPISAMVTALFNVVVSSLVLLTAYFVTIGLPPVDALFAPLLLVPLVLFTLGGMWFLSAFGVYLRDMQQFIGVLVTMIMFLSPLFYPLSAVPQSVRMFVSACPLTMVIEGIRGCLFDARLPEPYMFSALFAGSWLVLWLGYVCFVNTKKGFSDVI